MKATKVKTTEIHTDSQGEHIVCKGKLVLIKVEPEDTINGLSYRKDNNKFMFYPSSKSDHEQAQYIKPIIISKTEEIEVGDYALECLLDWTPKELFKVEYELPGECLVRKVLALPEQFSPNQLQAIIDGKLKDGDEVYADCRNINTHLGISPEWVIRLFDPGYIKLFKVNKKESWDSIWSKWKQYCETSNQLEGDSYMYHLWLESTHNPPKSK